MEFPQYTLRPNVARIVMPRIVGLILLGFLLYFGFQLNLFFLKIALSMIYNLLTIVIILFLVAIAAVQIYSNNSSIQYLFYPNKVIKQGKEQAIMMFSQVSIVTKKKNSWDNLFGTCTIILQPYLRIEHIQDSQQIYSYITNLVQYSRQIFK